jgi:uncharacterized hydantoinase/oxoprolinase family protein
VYTVPRENDNSNYGRHINLQLTYSFQQSNGQTILGNNNNNNNNVNNNNNNNTSNINNNNSSKSSLFSSLGKFTIDIACVLAVFILNIITDILDLP